MLTRAQVTAVLAAAVTLLSAAPAAADGEILLTHAKALAGNVTPGDPPGFPIVLTLPGVYQFAGVVHPTAGSMGIVVASADVTIDMNGFRLHGSGTALHGIAGAVDNVTVKNGTITGFKFDGIVADGEHWTVEDMRIVGNGRFGIEAGAFFRILNSNVSENGSVGVICTVHCLVTENVVAKNGLIGVDMSVGTVLGNTITDNFSYGISGGNNAGFGNNTLAGNNQNNQQTIAMKELQPNACTPNC